MARRPNTPETDHCVNSGKDRSFISSHFLSFSPWLSSQEKERWTHPLSHLLRWEINSGTVEGTSVPAFADFTYCNLHFACFFVTISGCQPGRVEVVSSEGDVKRRQRREKGKRRGSTDEHEPKARIRSSAKNLFLSNIEALAPGRFIISPWKYAASGPVPSAWFETAA